MRARAIWRTLHFPVSPVKRVVPAARGRFRCVDAGGRALTLVLGPRRSRRSIHGLTAVTAGQQPEPGNMGYSDDLLTNHTGRVLALRAEEAGAVHERRPAHRCAASRAGPSLPAVDRQRPVEVAALPVDIDVQRV